MSSSKLLFLKKTCTYVVNSLFLHTKINHLFSDQLFQRPYKGYFVSIDGCCHLYWSTKKCSHNETGFNWEIWMQRRVSPKVTIHLRQSGQHAQSAKIIFWLKNKPVHHFQFHFFFREIELPKNYSANQELSFVYYLTFLFDSLEIKILSNNFLIE